VSGAAIGRITSATVSPFVAASFHLLAVFFEQPLLIFIEQWQDLLVHAIEGTLHPTFCFLMDA
jgi:hypothetical protein